MGEEYHYSGENESLDIRNSLICNNTTDRYPTIQISNSKPTFNNVTISNNRTYYAEQGTFGITSSHQIKFLNSIVQANKSKSGNILFNFNNLDGNDTLSIEYSNIDTNYGSWNNEIANLDKLFWTEGNICTDPLFTNPESGDFTLSANSPCIDAGNPDEENNDVYDPYHPYQALWPSQGTLRNDMGAYGGGRKNYINTNTILPDDFNSIQNYPNPFNPETTIEFNISNQDRVVITIYNVLGQKIRNLFDMEVLPGKYKVDWNGINNSGARVGSGIYFYQIKTKAMVKTKKMVLVN
jgi:hypothetical protein